MKFASIKSEQTTTAAGNENKEIEKLFAKRKHDFVNVCKYIKIQRLSLI